MTAAVNKIIPLSTVDGPGARTAIFLQGCNIACQYCHNPETQNICRHCGSCVSVCPVSALAAVNGKVVWDPALCEKCDACLAACEHNASPKVLHMSAVQVMAEVESNIPFIRGITVSGGECMLYPEFLTELFRLAKKRSLTCLIDSNGSVPFSEYPELLALCDGVMLDVKSWDTAVYANLTGGYDNANVKQNLALLAEAGKLAELRVVFVPGMVDAEAVLEGIAAALGENCAQTRIKLIAFRPHGVRGPLANRQAPSADEMAGLMHKARQLRFGNCVLV